MTNRQWLMNEMQNMNDEELASALTSENFFCIKSGKELDGCGIGCIKCATTWLKSEHKEPIKLKDAERVILENVDKDYKWISRQYTGSIIVWECKPLKSDKAWLFSGGDGNTLLSFSHLFQFIKWSDSEPYNIEELLK